MLVTILMQHWRAVLDAIIVIALMTGALWLREHYINEGYAKAQAEYTVKMAQATQDALVKQQAIQKQMEDAQHAEAQREKVLQASAAATAAASASLRDELQTLRAGLPNASINAARHTADTLAAVLSECQSDFKDMAAKADRHANDEQTLMQAWPKP